ncbi:uncharacterized protein METZ01_LOCUS381381 [marine metagenome]|uniref:Uncharacterized protein n=1 Tax=marine metagenome TaxID=408172 RepID=A0A382U3I0_9ZZZZ
MDKAAPFIVASKPIVATVPVPVGLALILSIIIDLLYSDVLTLYSEIPYSAIWEFAKTMADVLLYPSV